MSSRFKTVALIGKYKNPDIIVPLLSLARYLQERNVEVVLDRLTASNVAGKQVASPGYGGDRFASEPGRCTGR